MIVLVVNIAVAVVVTVVNKISPNLFKLNLVSIMLFVIGSVLYQMTKGLQW